MTDPQRISAFSPITEVAATDSLVIVDVPDVPGGTKRTDASNLNINLVITAEEIAAGITPTNFLHPEPYPPRYGGVADNSTDSLVAIQNACKVSAQSGKAVIIDGPYFVDINDENDPIELLSNAHLIFTEKGSIRMDFFGLPLFWAAERDGIRIDNPHLINDATMATSLPAANAAFPAVAGRTAGLAGREYVTAILILGCDNATITDPKFTNVSLDNFDVWHRCITMTDHNDGSQANNNRILGTMSIEAAHNGIVAFGQNRAETPFVYHERYGDADPAVYTWASFAHTVYFTQHHRNSHCKIGPIMDEGVRLANAFVSGGVTLKLRDFEYGQVGVCRSKRDEGVLDWDSRHTAWEGIYWEGRDPAAMITEPFRALHGGGGNSNGILDYTFVATTLDTSHVATDTVLGVASTTSFVNNSPIRVLLDDGNVHMSSIVSFVAGVSVTISDSLPSAATSGNAVAQVNAYGKISTTLDTNEVATATVIGVASTGGMGTNAPVVIRLDDGSDHRSHIISIVAGVSITIEDGLLSAAASGNAISQEAENYDNTFKKISMRVPNKDQGIIACASGSQGVPDHVSDNRFDIDIFYEGTALDTGKFAFGLSGSDNYINSTWYLPNLSNSIILCRIDNGGDRNHMRAVIIDGPFSTARMAQLGPHELASTDNSIEIIDAKTGDQRNLNNNTAWEIRTASEIVTAASGATITATGIIPNGVFVIGVTAIVTTALGTSNGTTGFQVGTVADPNRWGVATAVTKNTITENDNWTAGGNDHFTSAGDIVGTADGGNFDGTGAIRFGVSYMIGKSNFNLQGG